MRAREVREEVGEFQSKQRNTHPKPVFKNFPHLRNAEPSFKLKFCVSNVLICACTKFICNMLRFVLRNGLVNATLDVMILFRKFSQAAEIFL